MINNEFSRGILRELRSWQSGFWGHVDGDESVWMCGIFYGGRVGVREWKKKSLSYFSFAHANSVFIKTMETIIFNGGIDHVLRGGGFWYIGLPCFTTFVPSVDIYISKLFGGMVIGARGGGRWA